MSTKYKPSPMRKEEFEALQTLVLYNWVDELQHWKENGEPTEGHVYSSLQLLQGYVTRCSSEQLEVPNLDGAIPNLGM